MINLAIFLPHLRTRSVGAIPRGRRNNVLPVEAVAAPPFPDALFKSLDLPRNEIMRLGAYYP